MEHIFLNGSLVRSLGVLVLIGLLLHGLCNVVLAQNAEADILIAQAILAYDKQKYAEALDLLEQAKEHEPDNLRGLFYTGLTYLAQNKPNRAIGPLNRANTLHPDNPDIQFQLGIAYFVQEKYNPARPLLEKVYQEEPERDGLGVYVGFLRLMEKKNEEALTALETAKSSDPEVQQLGEFYRTLALWNLGFSEKALTALKQVDEIPDTGPITSASLQLRDSLAALASKKNKQKAYSLQASLSTFYDDNVAINPNRSNNARAEALRQRSTTSPGLSASVLFNYKWLRKDPWRASIAYSFFQTIYLNDGLSRFNIQDHQMSLTGHYLGTLADVPYRLSAGYTFDYLFLNEAGFLARHVPTTSATIVPPKWEGIPFIGDVEHLTTLSYRYQIKTFFREPGDNDLRFGSEQRDGFNNAIGLSHVFRLHQDRVQLRMGYWYDNEATDGTSFTYTGNRVLTGGRITFPFGNKDNNKGITLDYNFNVHWRAYKHPQTFFLNDAGILAQRYDVQQSHLVQLSVPLPFNFSITGQYQRIRNDSNIPVFDYTKNVFTGLATWTY